MTNSVQIHVLQQKDSSSWPPYDQEVLWAVPTSDGYFQINCPVVYSQGLHYGDIVQAFPDQYGDLIFDSIIEHSHSETFLLVCMMPAWQRQQLLEEIQEIGARTDYASSSRLVSVIVPAGLDEDLLLDVFAQYSEEELFFTPKDLMRKMHQNIVD